MSSFVTGSSANESDQFALQAFKAEINDDPLGALSNWNNSIHYCEWYGVTCSRRHPNRVTELSFTSQKLGGTLSPHIGNLSFLRTISLYDNNFHGPIPQQVGRLFRLEILRLSNNSFDGQIPTNLTHCSRLSKLGLDNNKMSGRVPVELTSLPNLLLLGLYQNDLEGSIPSSLGNLSSLLTLVLTYNHLTGNIPEDLCRMHNIEWFALDENNLTGTVPSCIYNLTNMTDFGITANQLQGYLPLDIGLTLPKIQTLYVVGNNFKGPIPSSLLNASKLERLDLSSNQFTGQVPFDIGRLHALSFLNFGSNQLGSTSGKDLDFFHSLTNCTNLEFLGINNNFLKGLIPNSIANLSIKLEYLYLGSNQLHGSIPAGIQNLVGLNLLAIEDSHLTGGIPTSMGMLHKLEKLTLAKNHLSGEIPHSLGNLTKLSYLYLTQNNLHGKIPPTLGNCKFEELFLSANTLNGDLPKQIFNISSMFYINLSYNALSGPLPNEVGNLNNLMVLDISRNRLFGRIPDTLGSCLMLQILFMGNNLFEGKIPQELSRLTSIQQLNLSWNKLSGDIPKYLVNFTLLTSLDLSYNELEGSVPKDGVFANASLFLVVENRDLCGGIVELELPPCHIKTISKNKHLFHKVLIPAILVSFFLVLMSGFLLMLYRRKRRVSTKNPFPPSPYHHHYPRISYAELLKATNSFSVDNFVGSGSYGRVYKGILDKITTVVAVKVLNLEHGAASKSFLSECNALRNLRHRNLVKILTCCSSVDFHGNDFKALVFEFMPNGSLQEWLHRRRDGDNDSRNLTFLSRLNISIDVASALDYLHHHFQPTIVHCDIKPSNVLLNDDMTAHVADFGLAKILCASSNSSQSQESSFVVKGSVGYVAPEYGMGHPVSIQGDVYSYGILLLEMVTGKRPTDDMFHNGQNLHTFARGLLPEQVMTIADPMILLDEHEDSVTIISHSESGAILNPDRQFRMLECLLSLTRLGVACSAEPPTERMNMKDVLTELHLIKDHFQCI